MGTQFSARLFSRNKTLAIAVKNTHKQISNFPGFVFLFYMIPLLCARFYDQDYGSSIKYVRKIFRKTNIFNPLIRTRTRAYQRVKIVSFSDNFAHVINGWPLTEFLFHFSNKNSSCL